MRRKRYLLPEDRPDGRVNARQIGLLAVVELPVVAWLLWNGIERKQWLVIPALIAAAAGCLFWYGWLSGRIDTNYGIFHRHTEPFRYWLTQSLFALVYLAIIMGSFFAERHLG